MVNRRKIEPFLTLTSRRINGWMMTCCPELELSVWGTHVKEEVLQKRLAEMIALNSKVILASKKNEVSPSLRELASKIVKTEKNTGKIMSCFIGF